MHATPRIVFSALLLLSCSIASARVEAQSIAQAERLFDTPRERFSGQADVSGAKLVGLLLGLPNSTFDPNAVRLVAPTPGERSRLCLRVVTRDGLFWSDNPFAAPEESNTLIQAGPVSIDPGKPLDRYTPDQILIRGAVPQSDNCANLDDVRVYVPAIGGEDGPLRVYLNTAGRAAHARILTTSSPEEVLTSVACTPFESGAAVAADRVCVLDISDPRAKGQLDLHVVILSLDREHLHFPIRLPEKTR